MNLLRLCVTGSLIVLLCTASTLASESLVEREASPGDRLEIRNYKGTIRVVGWDRNVIRVEANHPRSEDIVVDHIGSRWLIVPSSWKRDSDGFVLRLPGMARVRVEGDEPPSAELVVSMPAEMSLQVETPFARVTVEGVSGPVDVTNMIGDISVDGGGTPMRLRSMTGRIELRGAHGRTTLEGTRGKIDVRDSKGELRIETTTGDIVLRALQTQDLEVTTVDGDIRLVGSLTREGRYELTTHSGDVQLDLRDPPDAQFSVRAFRGRIVSELEGEPLTDTSTAEFTLGDGSAQVQLKSFSGRIHLGRAQEDTSTQ